MIILLSPAKSLDFKEKLTEREHTVPFFLEESEVIIETMKKKSAKTISKLMDISTDLADLNYERYHSWNKSYTSDNSKQAAFAFTGEVYRGLDINSFSEDDLSYAQDRIITLSGLYGALKPLDLIQPYRLEMGTSVSIKRKKNLYAFWQKSATDYIKNQMQIANSEIVVNLASKEYFDVVDFKKLGAKVITPSFKDYKNGEYKMIQVFVKRTRGLMAQFIIKNKLELAEEILAFNESGYYFNAENSNETTPQFYRNSLV